MTTRKEVPSVSVSDTRPGSTTRSNELGMSPMQERAYGQLGDQYLLIKSPPTSRKSRALMLIALDELEDQLLRQAIIAVPGETIGARFADVPLNRSGFWTDWSVQPK